MRPGKRRIGRAARTAVLATVVAAASALVALSPANASEILDPQRDVHPFGNAGGFAGVVPSTSVAAIAATPTGGGYWLADRAGAVLAFGDAGSFGSAVDLRLNQPVVAIAATPTGLGYWLATADGGIFAFGDAPFLGSTGNLRLNQPIVGLARSASGAGYWLAASDGGIFAFGDAPFLGSTGNLRLNQPIVGLARSASGAGYWLAASDGGIFAFGDAPFLGSTGSLRLTQPIVGLARSASGAGYWLAASDGGIFAFGDAAFLGSASGRGLNAPVVAIAATPSGAGYWLATSGGCRPFASTVEKANTTPEFRVHLTDLQVAGLRCFDRVTFTFGSEAPAGSPEGIGWQVGYDPGPFFNTPGEIVPTPGPAFLKVRLFPASVADFSQDPPQTTYTGSEDIRPTTTRGVRAVQLVDDFEALQLWVISVDSVRAFSVTELSDPPRLVIDLV